MNIIKHGNPKKAEAEKRRKDTKRFRCPTCGALWDASISKKECRIVMQDYNDDRWVSDCPEKYCDGIGEEEPFKPEPLCENCERFYDSPKCKYAERPDQYADECKAYEPLAK